MLQNRLAQPVENLSSMRDMNPLPLIHSESLNLNALPKDSFRGRELSVHITGSCDPSLRGPASNLESRSSAGVVMGAYDRAKTISNSRWVTVFRHKKTLQPELGFELKRVVDRLGLEPRTR